MAAERGKADHHQSDNCCNRGDQQRAGEKPGCATDDSGADDRTSDVAEDRAQDRADRRNGDEQDQGKCTDIEVTRRRAPLRFRLRGEWLAFAHDADDAVDASVETCRELPFAE